MNAGRHIARSTVSARLNRLLLVLVVLLPLGCTPFTSRAAPPATHPHGQPLEAVQAAIHRKRAVKAYDATLRLTLADLSTFWQVALPNSYQETFKPLRGGIYAYSNESRIPSCGGFPTPYVLLQKNAFYCPEGDFIAWDDQQLFPELQRQHGTFLLSIVLAHEWGHAIQQRSVPDVYGIAAEQQADCFAGAWAAHLASDPGELGTLQRAELDQALAGFIEFRDQVGTTAQDAGAHGSAFDRIRGFQEGYEQGVARCAEYADQLPELVSVPYRNFKERFRGGNLPFDQVIPATETSLTNYWAAIRPQSIPSSPSSKISTCLAPVVLEGFSASEMSWCPLDNTIRYDRARLKRQYDEIGDVGVGTLFAILWAQADQVAAGHESTSRRAYLEALCRAGSYTGSLYNADDPESSQLSPGDMDEAVQTLLAMATTQGQSPQYGTGFEQVAAFRTGVLGTESACLPGQ
jgi:predicted metalloprotease